MKKRDEEKRRSLSVPDKAIKIYSIKVKRNIQSINEVKMNLSLILSDGDKNK